MALVCSSEGNPSVGNGKKHIQLGSRLSRWSWEKWRDTSWYPLVNGLHSYWTNGPADRCREFSHEKYGGSFHCGSPIQDGKPHVVVKISGHSLTVIFRNALQTKTNYHGRFCWLISTYFNFNHFFWLIGSCAHIKLGKGWCCFGPGEFQQRLHMGRPMMGLGLGNHPQNNLKSSCICFLKSTIPKSL